jgi:hypothetical protein
LVPTEFEAVDVSVLGLGVVLGTAGTEEFIDGKMLPLLPKANALELEMGKGKRFPAELVPIDAVVDVFELRLGVTLGTAGIEEFIDGKTLPLLPKVNALELGMGKGKRFPAELVPIEFELKVAFMLELGVALGGLVIE